MEVKTRFCPTIESGLLHIGHLFNACFNSFYAEKHGYTTCCLLDLNISLTEMSREQLAYSKITEGGFGHGLIANHKDAGRNHRWEDLFGRNIAMGDTECIKRCNLHLIRQYMFDMCFGTPNLDTAYLWERLVPELPQSFYSLLERCPFYAMPIADYLLKTNVFIRGRDLQPKPNMTVGEKLLSEMRLRDMIFDDLASWEIKRYYHPLLLDADGSKMSKITEVKHPSALALMSRIFEHEAHPPHVFLWYVVSTIEGRIVDNEELKSYSKRFDIEKVCEMDDFVYDDEMMQEIIERVAKYCRDPKAKPIHIIPRSLSKPPNQ